MNREEIIYTIALTQVPGIGTVWARNLINAMGNAVNVFNRRKELPKFLPGITQRVIQALDYPQAISRAGKEYEFAEKNQIDCFPITHPDYPQRLKECPDAPVILFFKGKANLNEQKIISIVGTRKATDYGKQICTQFIKDLKAIYPEILIVSGLAYGIDIHAHRCALENQLPTIGVLAHGLDRIYPHVHRKTAVEMLSNGGLLTEYLTETNPDRYNFVARNRIVAGISDATIVIESAAKGGSLITADIAGDYHRDCFAFPGRTTDVSSRGCNRLIKDNKAALIESADDFLQLCGWSPESSKKVQKTVQRTFFPDLSEEEQLVVSVLQKEGSVQINNLIVATDIPVYKMSSLLFELEMKGIIRVLAGGVYQLV